MEPNRPKANDGADIASILGPGRPGYQHLPSSASRFPDGVSFRVEIPSVEGPNCMSAVLSEAARLNVPVRRMSQGSGVMLLTDAELDEMAVMASSNGIEVSLFARPCAGWGISAAAMASAGSVFAGSARGLEQLQSVADDMIRAAEHGFRSILVSDLGALSMFGQLREGGYLPQDMQAKVSVMLPIANPATARVLVDLGASTLNLQPDLDVGQISAIRSAVDVPLDIYIESPDNIGGFVRHDELPEIVRVAAPVYIKFGLRNAPDIYPSGSHLDPVAISLSIERVRRAKIGMEVLSRSGADMTTSEPGAKGLAIPHVKSPS